MAKSKDRSRDRAPTTPGVKSDAYVGMLALALIAQVAGAVFLWLDYDAYGPNKKPTMPADRPTVGATQPAAPPAPPDKGK